MQNLSVASRPFAALTLAATLLAGVCRIPAAPLDSRNFANGHLIPDEHYCDQPRIVVTRDGTWVCILTTNKGEEGDPGQHIVATRSTDKGKTWSPLVDVEPADREVTSAYAIALITPFDRIYAIYCYNGDRIRALPDGTRIRDDMQGWCCFRYSDDQGRTWSERHRIPMRVTAADRGNQWGGKLQMWWAIGTPAYFNGSVMFGFTKLGRYILEEGEGWFFRSDNVLTERDPAKVRWELLPEGDHGVRAPEFGTVQEEFDLVHLEGESFFTVYRTTKGHAACAYSRDGGHSWSRPEPLRYRPGGRIVKQPRACTKIWKTKNGRYLLWYHNNGTTTYNNGLNAGSRNIAWLSAGRLENGQLLWSQPEIVAYVEGGLEGCSYPDLIEDGGRYYICATQKTEARVWAVDNELIEGLWEQHTRSEIAPNALALELSAQQCVPGSTARAPRIAPLIGQMRRRSPHPDTAGGLTLDLSVRFDDLSPGQVLLDSRGRDGAGYLLRTAEHGTLRFEMSDGWQAAYWDCDAGLLQTNSLHQVAVIVDGRPNVICFVVDGELCDGGRERPFGFGRFNPTFKDISGGGTLRIAPSLQGRLEHLRLYSRALRVSEVIANQRHASTAARSATQP